MKCQPLIKNCKEWAKKKKATKRNSYQAEAVFSSQNTEYPKLLRGEYNSINWLCKTNVIPRLAGSWVKIKLNFWKPILYGYSDRIWCKWRFLGKKYNLNIISPLIGLYGLDKMIHWVDYIREHVF